MGVKGEGQICSLKIASFPLVACRLCFSVPAAFYPSRQTGRLTCPQEGEGGIGRVGSYRPAETRVACPEALRGQNDGRKGDVGVPCQGLHPLPYSKHHGVYSLGAGGQAQAKGETQVCKNARAWPGKIPSPQFPRAAARSHHRVVSARVASCSRSLMTCPSFNIEANTEAI